MKIVIMGAGAIGSLYGALLSQNNDIFLIGRDPHISTIKKHGLKIDGKTKLKLKLNAETSINNVYKPIDLLILTVKSYDTKKAIAQAKPLIDKRTIVLSLQNGLDNIDKIKEVVNPGNIVLGVTTNGALFLEPGAIEHTGKGTTIIGELSGKKTNRINDMANIFNRSKIETSISDNILRDIWIKAIINSSINPLTAFFKCKNGYLLENPILENLTEKICLESTNIAKSKGYNLSYKNMITKTKDVIRNTSNNYSSMLQSHIQGKKSEIEEINGELIDTGNKNNVDTSLNEMLVLSLASLQAS